MDISRNVSVAVVAGLLAVGATVVPAAPSSARTALAEVAALETFAPFRPLPRPATPVPVATPGLPRVIGTARVGSVLTARPPRWAGHVVGSYQWYRNGRPLVGERRATHKLSVLDAGARLGVKVTWAVTGSSKTVVRASGTVLVATAKPQVTLRSTTGANRAVVAVTALGVAASKVVGTARVSWGSSSLTVRITGGRGTLILPASLRAGSRITVTFTPSRSAASYLSSAMAVVARPA